MNKPARALIPLAGFFLLVSVILVLFREQLTNAGFAIAVLHGANILFFIISIISFFIQLRGIAHPNPHVFVRSVMSGMMLKMLVCLVVTFVYIYSAGSDYNKRSVFVSLFLYLFYLAIEVAVVMKMNKKKNA